MGQVCNEPGGLPARRPGGTTRLTTATVALLLLSGWASAPAAHEAQGPLSVWSDYAAFRMMPGSTHGYVEFYFEMKRADFTFRRIEGAIRADVYTWVHISDSTGAPYDSVGGAFVAVVADSADLADAGFTLFFARALELPPGSYRAQVVVTDLDNKATSEVTYPVRVPAFVSDRLMLSDLEFGYEVHEAPADTVIRPYDVLVKNQYKVYPDCRAILGPARPRLYFYLEAYNFTFDSAGTDNIYQAEFAIVPTDGSPVRTLGVQTVRKPGTSAVLAKSVGVGDLPAGLYRFRVAVSDPAVHARTVVEKPFQVIAPSLDTLTAEDIRQLRDIITYIATPAELATFESLNAVGKRNFMVQFWRDRDPTPGTPVNEFRDEHLRRMNVANETYSTGLRDRTVGWRTDRGRIFVVYGPPNHVERFPFAANRPAAERWNYESLPGQGSVYFLFVDERGYGDYKMVHSNARGERRDPGWENAIKEGVFDNPY